MASKAAMWQCNTQTNTEEDTVKRQMLRVCVCSIVWAMPLALSQDSKAPVTWDNIENGQVCVCLCVYIRVCVYVRETDTCAKGTAKKIFISILFRLTVFLSTLCTSTSWAWFGFYWICYIVVCPLQQREWHVALVYCSRKQVISYLCRPSLCDTRSNLRSAAAIY